MGDERETAILCLYTYSPDHSIFLMLGGLLLLTWSPS